MPWGDGERTVSPLINTSFNLRLTDFAWIIDFQPELQSRRKNLRDLNTILQSPHKREKK